MAINKSNIVAFIFFVVSALLLLATLFSHQPLHQPHHKTDKPGKARYIFVDLGANRADSLEAFFGHENAKFTYDFPRPTWATHEEAEIYLFEANPVFNAALVEAKERYDALGIKITIFPSTVADFKDGSRIFFIDNVNTEQDYWGSSTHASHPDVAKSGTSGTELRAIDIARWLLMNTLPRDFVVVKMDIEGSEYEVIPHMATMSVWTVLDYLLVEWHPHTLGEGYDQETVKAAQDTLVAKGVNMPAYDSAA